MNVLIYELEVCCGHKTNLKASDVSTEEWCKLATATLSATLVAHLIVENVRLDFNTLVDVAMLQLNETGRDGSNVALLVGESHATSTLDLRENLF